jgi:hypothetical protein
MLSKKNLVRDTLETLWSNRIRSQGHQRIYTPFFGRLYALRHLLHHIHYSVNGSGDDSDSLSGPSNDDQVEKDFGGGARALELTTNNEIKSILRR